MHFILHFADAQLGVPSVMEVRQRADAVNRRFSYVCLHNSFYLRNFLAISMITNFCSVPELRR